MKQQFDVTGMSCSACSSRIEKEVSKLDGSKECSVNLLTNSMQVTYDEKMLNDDKIIETVEHSGYGASVKGADVRHKSETRDVMQDEIKQMKHRLIASFVFLIPLFYISMGHMMGLPLPSFLTGHENAHAYAFTQFLLTIPIMIINQKYFTVGFKSLIQKAPNMDTLIAIGSSASFIYGIYAIYMIGYGLGHMDMVIVEKFHMDLYFESAGMILTLITLGKYLETKSKGKTSEAIRKLMDLSPKTAFVIRDGQEVEVPVENVAVKDIVIVKPGMSVPVDGVIVEGSSSFDESALTGESIPVNKSVGDNVSCATINVEGFVKLEATKVGNDTTLATMIRLVEEASSSKAPIAKLADKISGIFVPVVIAIAVISMVVWLILGATFEFALSIGISVLVISCPCALGLATPVAIMVGTGLGAQHGILIKSGEALEVAHNVTTVVLDKTGTITEGKPHVVNTYANAMSQEQLVQIAASLEAKSEHPLPLAAMEKAKEMNLELLEVSDFEALFGKGIQGKIQGVQYYAGNERLMNEKNIDISQYQMQLDALADDGKTPLIFASEAGVIGILGLADVIKENSAKAIAKLKKMGIRVIMLTGDHIRTAKAIQRQSGVDEVFAQVLPSDKEKHVAELKKKGEVVAMVGDGINDALALTSADVGIAIGAGSDIAIESADVVLMRSDLMDVVSAIELSKATIRNIKQNLFWAFFYNAIGIPLAAGVFYGILNWKMNPMFASAAMSLSSVSVVTNALRLKRYKLSSDESVSETHHEKESEGKKEENHMKTLKIEGMMCMHCKKHVEDALNAIGAEAVVDLENKSAVVNGKVSDEAMKKAVSDAGYTVTEIIE